MDRKELINGVIAALENKPSTNFSASDVDRAAVSAILAEAGISENPTAREIRENESKIFSIIEEAVDEILPAKLQNVLGEYAEVRVFPRDAAVEFNIEKIGRNRAKLVISEGARAGVYRAARLSNRVFAPATKTYVAAVYVTLEDLILGTNSLADLFKDILEGFEEKIYKEVFNALAAGTSISGNDKITGTAASKDALGAAIDKVMPIVKQYGTPTIFGSYAALSELMNGTAIVEDLSDIRNHGFVQVYKGTRVVELPNYLIDNTNKKWFYDQNFVFVIPSGAKPVKIAMKGEMYIQKNEEATGSQKWNAHKIMGVGLAMANNYAVIDVTLGA